MSSIIDRNPIYKQFKGEQPAADRVSKRVKAQIFERTIPKYGAFLQERLASGACDYIKQMADQRGVFTGGLPKDRTKPFFLTDLDFGLNGAVGNAGILVKPGAPEKPIRIIVSHSDVPCLKIRAQPVYIEADAEKSMGCPSVALSAEEFGGVRPEDWYGREVDVLGKIYTNGKVKSINLPGRIKQKSVHVDDRDDLKTYSGLKVDTGFRTIAELYAALGIKSHMDFGRASLYVVPNFGTGANGRLVGNDFSAFGQDDRVCMWTSMVSGLEAMTKTDNTIIVAALENEEIGSSGISASYRGFFEGVLKETIKRVHGTNARKIDLPLDLSRGLLGNLPVIVADVDVGIGFEEMEDGDKVDFKSAAKMGWGFFISGQAPGSSWQMRNMSAKHIDGLMSLFKRRLPTRTPEQRYQVTGSPNTLDSESMSGTLSDQFDKYFPCIDMGIPIVGLHHPGVEVANVYDLHWLKEGYGAYLKA